MNIHDSVGGLFPSASGEKSIGSILQYHEKFITIYSISLERQTNTNECGVNALAIAVSILYRLGQRKIIFRKISSKITCLNVYFVVSSNHFLIMKSKSLSPNVMPFQALTFELYCSCSVLDVINGII